MLSSYQKFCDIGQKYNRLYCSEAICMPKIFGPKYIKYTLEHLALIWHKEFADFLTAANKCFRKLFSQQSFKPGQGLNWILRKSLISWEFPYENFFKKAFLAIELMCATGYPQWECSSTNYFNLSFSTWQNVGSFLVTCSFLVHALKTAAIKAFD